MDVVLLINGRNSRDRKISHLKLEGETLVKRGHERSEGLYVKLNSKCNTLSFVH